MTTRNIKLITLDAREWFDKVNGNSYFTCDITINGELIHTLPMQYGYGNHYEDVALQWLKENIFSKQLISKIDNTPFWRVCSDFIKCFKVSHKSNVLKREL